MTKNELAKFLQERGATPDQVEMIEQEMLKDIQELARLQHLVPGLAWLEQQLVTTRVGFVSIVKWKEAQGKGLSFPDLSELGF